MYNLFGFYCALQKKLESDLNKVNEKIAKTQTSLENITPQYEALRDREEICTQQYAAPIFSSLQSLRNCYYVYLFTRILTGQLVWQWFVSMAVFLGYTLIWHQDQRLRAFCY